MEFPEINMISDFEAGVKCLQNPSLVSRFFTLSPIEKIPQVYSFWKWGALVLAILATFSSLIRKIKLLLIYVRKIKPSAEPLLQYLGEDFDISDDDDKCSSLASSDDEDLLDQQIDEDFTVTGSSIYLREKGQNRNLRHRPRRNSFERYPWTEYSAGRNVVKLWDSLALGLDYEYEDLSKSVVSLWDLNQEGNIGNLFSGSSQVPSVAMASPTVVLSSEMKNNRNVVVLAAYDTRMKSQSPAICADWGAGSGKLVGVNSAGVGKVYISNEAAGMLTVGDMRNVKTPLRENDGKLTITRGGTPLLSRKSLTVEIERVSLTQ